MRLKLFSVAVLSVLSLPVLAADGEGYIKIRSTPRGAGIFLDGKYVGPAGRFSVPERYAVAPGSHEIVLKDPRFEDFSGKIEARAGKTAKMNARLKRKPDPAGPFGRLRLSGGEGESFWSVAAGDTGPFYLNGAFMGHVDELNNLGGGLLVPAGTYELLVQSQIYGEVRKNVTIEAGKVVKIAYGTKKEQ